MKQPRFRKPRKSISQLVPTVWFVDLANLLIFYFLATTSLTKIKGFEADLPAGQQAEAAGDAKIPAIAVRDGAITFNAEAVELAGLRERLDALGLKDKTGEEKLVMFETAGSVSYQDYFAVMSCIAQAGGVAVIATEER